MVLPELPGEAVTEFDAILLTSFGGPEGSDDVEPFLRNVASGREIPEKRLIQVKEQYGLFGGISPINQQNRELIEALREELDKNGIPLPIYFGNRNWKPFLKDTIEVLHREGKRNVLALVTSAFGSYSGCRQYQEDLQNAISEAGAHDLKMQKIRLYWNHPGFFAAMQSILSSALLSLDDGITESTRLVFTAHSIPSAWEEFSPYKSQLLDFAESLSASVASDLRWDLAFQSRSGPPTIPWLEPDILDHLETLDPATTSQVVLIPIGFLSDHMEVIYDLDNQALPHAETLGFKALRTPTVGTHPEFVTGLRQLIEEKVGGKEPLVAFGEIWECSAKCCSIPSHHLSAPSKD